MKLEKKTKNEEKDEKTLEQSGEKAQVKSPVKSEKRGKKEKLNKSGKKTKKEKPAKIGGEFKKDRPAKSVVYLTQLPHGFYEQQIKSYFLQFGKVLRIRVARSRKTLKSKGYGYVEFEDDEVAKIAADAMNNYLMFDKLIKSRYIPPEKVHPNMFFRPQKVSKLISTRTKAINEQNSTEKPENHKKMVKKILKKLEEKKLKLKELGIDFKFEISEDSIENFENKQSKTSDQQAVTKQVDCDSPPPVKLSQKKKRKLSSINGVGPNADESGNKNATEDKLLEKTEKIKKTPKKKGATKNTDGSSSQIKKSQKKKRKLDSSNEAGQYVLEIQSSDEEISFKTPPNAIKKRLLNGNQEKANSVKLNPVKPKSVTKKRKRLSI